MNWAGEMAEDFVASGDDSLGDLRGAAIAHAFGSLRERQVALRVKRWLRCVPSIAQDLPTSLDQCARANAF